MLGESHDSELAQRQMKKDLFNTSFYSFRLYAGFFIPTGVTFMLALWDTESSSSRGLDDVKHVGGHYLWLLWLMFGHHLVQVGFISYYIFGWMRNQSKKRTSQLILIFLAITPFIMLVLQIVMLVTYGESERIEYLWIISDCIILSLLYVSFMW